MIKFGEHFLGAAGSNLLVQNEKGIMPAIHNSRTAGICANNFSKLIEPIPGGLVCNGFEPHHPELQISLFARARPKLPHNAMSALLLTIFHDFTQNVIEES